MRTKAPEFKDFWKAYPLHKGKLDAEKAWARLSATDKSKALAALPRYRDYIRQTCTAVKYPQGWLNGHRWEDEYDEPSSVAGAAITAPAATKTEHTVATPEPLTVNPEPGDTLSDMETW